MRAKESRTMRGLARLGKICNIWVKRNERPNIGGVSGRSRDGAWFPEGCVVDG